MFYKMKLIVIFLRFISHILLLRNFGHIMRKDKLEYLVVTGKIVGKRTRGRRRMLFTNQLVKWTNCDNTIELVRKASQRELIAANVF